ncbi:MAG: DUF2461 domain-containing protein [Myxococcales bacterium]|nr:DUF2461 domain-containing protein [Myxococcales bacterium]
MPAKKPKAQPHFTPELYAFLEELVENNDRDWFTANKARYEEHVKEPMLRFISDFQAPLARVSKHFVADPRPQGGSMFRIYRDTRFAKDKTPYKTHLAAHFRHETAKDVHAPGFYLHIEPESVMIGAGLWRPDSGVAAQIREAIIEDPAGYKRAAHAKKLREQAEFHGESLKRPPRGIDADHPLIDDLKRKSWAAMIALPPESVMQPDFIDRVAGACKLLAPLTRFLTEAVGQPF